MYKGKFGEKIEERAHKEMFATVTASAWGIWFRPESDWALLSLSQGGNIWCIVRKRSVRGSWKLQLWYLSMGEKAVYVVEAV